MLDMCGEKDDSLFPGFQQRYNKFNNSVIFCSCYIASLFLLAEVFYEFWEVTLSSTCQNKHHDEALIFYTWLFSK